MTRKRRTVPVVVTLRITCGCGHATVEQFEFDLPRSADPVALEEVTSGTCPECGAPIRVHLRRTSALQ